jgi:hypothetical protein
MRTKTKGVHWETTKQKHTTIQSGCSTDDALLLKKHPEREKVRGFLFVVVWCHQPKTDDEENYHIMITLTTIDRSSSSSSSSSASSISSSKTRRRIL